jgi:uncharacterized caspase-like protein
MKQFCIALLFALVALKGWGQSVPLAGAHAVELWDPYTGKLSVKLGEELAVYDVAFSLDGTKLASAGKGGLGVWHTSTGKRLWRANDPCSAVVFSPDGKSIATVGLSRQVRLWDAESGHELSTFSGHTAEITAVAFSPDARLLASASVDRTIRIWDVITGRELRTLVSDGAVYALDFSPDMRLVFTGGEANKMSVWSVQTGQMVEEWTRPAQQVGGEMRQGIVLALSVSPDGTMLAAAGTDQVCTLYKLSMGHAELVHIFGDTLYPITAVKFAQMRREIAAKGAWGQVLVTGGFDRSVRIWDLRSNEVVRSFQSTEGPISAIAVTESPSYELRVATATNFAEVTETKALHLLAVGIDHYPEGHIPNRPASTEEVREISVAFRERSGDLFQRMASELLVDSYATRHNLLSALRRVAKEARPTDTFVFFFSGSVLRRNDEIYLVPVDAGYSSGRFHEEELISISELTELLSRLPVERQLIMLSTGDGSNLFREMDEGFRSQNAKFSDLIVRSTALITIPANQREMQDGSPTLARWIVDGLNGNARDSSGFVTAKSLLEYIRAEMRRSSNTADVGGEQTVSFYGLDFPLAHPGPAASNEHPVGAAAEKRAADRSHAELRLADLQRGQPAPPSVTQDWRGFPKVQTAPVPLPPRHDYALIFEGTHYDHQTNGQGWLDLKFPEKDTEAISNSLHNLFGFDAEVVPDPDLAGILAKLREYRHKSFGPEDQLLVMFAGHGDMDDVDGYIVTKNSKPNDFSFDLPYSYLRQILDNTPARHILLVLDACYDGAIEPHLAPTRLHTILLGKRGERPELVVWRRGEASDLNRSTLDAIAEAYPDETSEISNGELVHEKLRYVSRQYLVSGGREPVPDQSAFAAKIIEMLNQAATSGEVLSATQLYSRMERLKPQPHEENFGRYEPWSDFLFVPKGVETH